VQPPEKILATPMTDKDDTMISPPFINSFFVKWPPIWTTSRCHQSKGQFTEWKTGD